MTYCNETNNNNKSAEVAAAVIVTAGKRTLTSFTEPAV